ncbi:MAG: hypothetical protein RLZZ416_25 [Candidatus Parcubacteria bacterium]|jgi:ribonuclease HI
MADLLIYTDGGARGNPGPAACAAILVHEGKRIASNKTYLGDRCTNNAAEYEGLILGLTEAKKRGFAGKTIEVRMDSELIVRQMSGEYQIKEETLWPYYMRAHNLLVAHFPHARFVHVRREQNEEADRLVNDAIDEA